jgi:hypothetical protein
VARKAPVRNRVVAFGQYYVIFIAERIGQASHEIE